MKGTDQCYFKARSCQRVLRQCTSCKRVETRKDMISLDRFTFCLIYALHTAREDFRQDSRPIDLGNTLVGLFFLQHP